MTLLQKVTWITQTKDDNGQYTRVTLEAVDYWLIGSSIEKPLDFLRLFNAILTLLVIIFYQIEF